LRNRRSGFPGAEEYEVRKAMTLSSTDINEIVRALQDTDWDEAVVSVDDVTIALARNGATLPSAALSPSQNKGAEPQNNGGSAPAPAPVAGPTPSNMTPHALTAQASESPSPTITSAGERQPDDAVVTATSVGVFWESSEPGAAPFVQVGDKVQADDVVCIVEIMKLMNHVSAGADGVLTEVLVENGQSVQLGTPLFVIRPQEA
jgi:acetyl-CoA carboxylase biotin carboxyl carrier protein